MKYLRNVIVGILRHFGGFIPDKEYLKIQYRLQMGESLNLKSPKSFNDKINWLKLYYRKSEFTKMVDKYAVKEYVASLIGEKYIIPSFGVWRSPEVIDWDTLPEQFVLKTTHGGGNLGVIICKDKTKLDKELVIKKLRKALKGSIYKTHREWPYKNVLPQIIAEKFMAVSGSNTNTDLSDYKFFCFNGEPLYCQVIRDRNTKETIDFYDMAWNHQEFFGLNPVARNGLTPVARPKHLDDMIRICKVLARDIPFVRVDLYDINNEVYFGEITFYPASGIGKFTPIEWNNKLGNLIKLPNV